MHFLPWNEIYKLFFLVLHHALRDVFGLACSTLQKKRKPFGLADASEGKGLKIDDRSWWERSEDNLAGVLFSFYLPQTSLGLLLSSTLLTLFLFPLKV